MIATWATLVSPSEVMKQSVPVTEMSVKHQPGHSMRRKLRNVSRPSRRIMKSRIPDPPNRPRQTRIVQLSRWIRRVKNPAVLQASADAVTNTKPNLYRPSSLMAAESSFDLHAFTFQSPVVFHQRLGLPLSSNPFDRLANTSRTTINGS